MSSVSGLSAEHRERARTLAVQAATLGLNHASAIHYTQGAQRWQGINLKLIAAKGHYPTEADCSSFATWCLWNGLYVPFHVRDVVNGENWRAGFTGTQLHHGKVVVHETSIKRADLALYGHRPNGSHVAVCVGRNKRTGRHMVISHGSEGGPYLLDLHYRRDLIEVRRYI